MNIRNKPCKIILFFVLVVISFVLLLFSGFHFFTKVSIARNGTPICCDEPLVDFGKIYRPVIGRLKHTFIIRNTSQRTVGLHVPKKSCSCTEAKFTSSEIASGEQTELTITWKVPNHPGNVMVDVVVETSPPGNGQIKLRGKASVVDCLAVDPLEVSFGEVKPNETKISEIVVSIPLGQGSPSDVSFETTGGPHDEFFAALTKIVGHKMFIKASITGQAGEGLRDYSVIVKTGNPDQPRIEIPVHANHLGVYQAKPSAVLLKSAEAGSPIKWVRIISNNNDSSIKIERLVIDNPSLIDVHRRVADDNVVELGLSLKNSNTQDSHTGKVEVFLVGEAKPVTVRYLRVGA